MSPALILIALIGAHFLADHPLQGTYLALGKNRFTSTYDIPWYHAMLAHVVIHGTLVALITGIWWLFFAEAIVHFITDDLKCSGRINFTTDQAIHIGCKIIWWIVTLHLTYWMM